MLADTGSAPPGSGIVAGQKLQDGEIDWRGFNCPRCGVGVYFPYRGHDPETVRCSWCKWDVPLQMAQVRDDVAPPADIQLQALMDEAEREEERKVQEQIPEHLRKAEAPLLRMWSRYYPVDKYALPMLEWLLDVAEDPTLHGTVRVYRSLRVAKRGSASALTWALRRAIVKPLLPLALSPNVTFNVVPIGLTFYVYFGLTYLDSTLSPTMRPPMYPDTLSTIKNVASIMALFSIFAVLRLAVVEPGFLEPHDPQVDPISDYKEDSLRRAGRCPTCYSKRVPRAGHCKTCKLCVERLDHHCHVLGQCVGRRNYGLFCWYIVLIIPALSCALVWWSSIIGLWPRDGLIPTPPGGAQAVLEHEKDDHGWMVALFRVGVLVSTFGIIVAFLVFTLGMFLNIAQTLRSGLSVREVKIGYMQKRDRAQKQQQQEQLRYEQERQQRSGNAISRASADVVQAAAELASHDGEDPSKDIDNIDDGLSIPGRVVQELAATRRGPVSQWLLRDDSSSPV